MTTYLLDTTALIDFSKDREPARSRILQMIDEGDALGVCAINVTEFYAGIPPDARRTAWEEFLASLEYWDITRTAAQGAGRYRYDFARRGITLSITDTLIAAVARERQAIIVTNNVKDYPMEDVRLLTLRAGDS